MEDLIFLYGLDKGFSEAFLIRGDYKEPKELRKLPQSGGGGSLLTAIPQPKITSQSSVRCAGDFRYQLNFLLLFINLYYF